MSIVSYHFRNVKYILHNIANI